MPLQSGGRAPYAPPQAVTQFFDAYRDRPIPAPITNEVLVRAGVSESLAPRVLKSLEDLELIDENGRPSAELEGLRRASAEEYSQRLAAIVRHQYADVFQYVPDPANADPTRIADQFRNYEPMGQRSRMVTLFLGLCEAAGIIPQGARPSAPPRTANGAARPRAAAPSARRGPEPRRNPPSMPLRVDEVIPPAILGVLRGLPPNGRGWTADQRRHFLNAFTALLDYSIPMRTAAEVAGPAADDDDQE